MRPRRRARPLRPDRGHIMWPSLGRRGINVTTIAVTAAPSHRPRHSAAARLTGQNGPAPPRTQPAFIPTSGKACSRASQTTDRRQFGARPERWLDTVFLFQPRRRVPWRALTSVDRTPIATNAGGATSEAAAGPAGPADTARKPAAPAARATTGPDYRCLSPLPPAVPSPTVAGASWRQQPSPIRRRDEPLAPLLHRAAPPREGRHRPRRARVGRRRRMTKCVIITPWRRRHVRLQTRAQRPAPAAAPGRYRGPRGQLPAVLNRGRRRG